jgi:enoyl-CoA hydratase
MLMPPVATANPIDAPAVRFAAADGIGTVTFSNPARMNALTAGMWSALPGLIEQAEADPAVRVIILRGAGEKAFSAGADISEFESARTGDNAQSYDALNDAVFNALQAATKPVIAMIHGFCLGGGLGIAACCDLRLADDKAQFAIPAAKLGIGYNQRWIRPLLAMASPHRVKELLFTGDRFSAADALQMGLVNRVCLASELQQVTLDLASRIASNAPLSVKAAKAAIDNLHRHPDQPDTARLDRLTQACFDSDDYAEGRRAFLEKRKPQFKGQ